MKSLAGLIPRTPVEPIMDVIHGIAVTDSYRWLEHQDSPRTRAWIEQQTCYTRSYLNSIAGRERIRMRVRELLAVKSFSSMQRNGNNYFFLKRLADQEQPCIYMRQGPKGKDQLLVDPLQRGTGAYTSVRPLEVSADGRILLYEVKQGGERTGTFELLDIQSRKRLPDGLPKGYLRGFTFAPDGKSFYYVHEAVDSDRPFYRAAYQHILGTSGTEDMEIFCAGDDPRLRLCLIADETSMGFLVFRFYEKKFTDFYIKGFSAADSPSLVVSGAQYLFGPVIMQNRVLAITDLDAPNRRIVEVHVRPGAKPEFIDLVPAKELRIQRWLVTRDRLLISYTQGTRTKVVVHDLQGKKVGEIPAARNETIRLVGGSQHSDDAFLEFESFVEPTVLYRYMPSTCTLALWAKRVVLFNAKEYVDRETSYKSLDGTEIPMRLFGRKDVVDGGCHPAIMTSYGGYGVPVTPQFSAFVAFLVEHGCLFALPSIRGGSEFGSEWHTAAKRRNRQTAYDDFLAGAEWLVDRGLTNPKQFAIFGGSNSGLLVGVSLTQKPQLFRAVLCMVPMLDMIRYHLFDSAQVWKDEFGTADSFEDFSVLIRYSPYHNVKEGVSYPAVMLVSGDADGNCNPLHARKMTARLQAANTSPRPIFLDYSKSRGHSPVLPFTHRVDALTDRLAFICDQLGIPI